MFFKTKSPLPFIIVLIVIAIVAIAFFFVLPAVLGDPTVTSTGDATTWSWSGSFEF